MPEPELSDPEKAVLLLLSLDESVAAPIVSELAPDQVELLRTVASKMKKVPTNALQLVYDEFLAKSGEAIAMPRGRVDFIRRISSQALGENETQEIFNDRPKTPMDRVSEADVDSLAALLQKEDPQLTAALLSQLPPEKGAAVIEMLPEEKRPMVLTKLGSMTEIPGHLVEQIAVALEAELPQPGTGGVLRVDGIAHSAALVRSLTKETCELVLGDVEAENELLAAEIRQAMYSFEDLIMIDPRAMRELLKAVPGERLTLALKTASEELTEHIFSGMSKRAAERVREDLTLLGAVRLSEVEEAQREVVEIALRLEAEGTLSLGGGAGEDLV